MNMMMGRGGMPFAPYGGPPSYNYAPQAEMWGGEPGWGGGMPMPQGGPPIRGYSPGGPMGFGSPMPY